MMPGTPGGMGTGGMGGGMPGGGMPIPRQPMAGPPMGGGSVPGGTMPGGGGGMMGRDTIERIVSSLDTGTLLKALSAVGVRIDGAMAGAGGMPGMSMDAPIVDQMAPWGATLVRVPLTQRRPLVDLSQTTDAPQPPASLLSSFGGADAGNIAPWAAATAG